MDLLRELFFSCLPEMPEPMRFDLFNYFWEKYTPSGRGRSSYTPLLDVFGYIVELFDGEYVDDDEYRLGDEDLNFVKDTVSDFALDLDQEFVSFVMKIAVSRGLFDRGS